MAGCALLAQPAPAAAGTVPTRAAPAPPRAPRRAAHPRPATAAPRPGLAAGMEEEAWQGGTSDCTAGELAQLMYWLMITGYTLRQLEQRCDLTRTLDLPAPEDSEPPGLPPGRQR